MDRPTQITVYGQKFKIKYVKDLYSAGLCDSKASLILIDDSLKGKDLVSTLLHEAIHAVFGRIGLRQGIELSTEETIAESISVMIEENFKLIPKK